MNRKTPEAEKILEEKQADGDQHLEFCAQQYEAQMARGKFFLHEHPRDATSWTRPSIERIKNRDDVYLVTGALWRYGLVSRDEHGQGLCKKAMSFMTNSREIANLVFLRCTNDRQAIGVWREYGFGVKRAGGPRLRGPCGYQVVRSVILDVQNMVVLQDLTDVANATQGQWRFPIPSHCKEIQTIYYYAKDGFSWHRHVPLTDGRAREAQIYPEGFVRAIVQGLLRQLRKSKPAIMGLSWGRQIRRMTSTSRR